MTSKRTVRIGENQSADQYKEYDKMVTIQILNERDVTLTDIIFNSDRTLKFIKSELSKDDLKKLMLKIIDDHYDRYK